MKDNPTLKKLFDADQAERLTMPNDHDEQYSYWRKLTANDKKRRDVVKKIQAEGKIVTALDFYHAAMICHHGGEIADSVLAQSLAETAMKKGLEKAKWLYAATTDRLLRKQEKRQKFGTQYEQVILKEGEEYFNAMLMQPYDKRTTDETRAKYNVPKLSELKKSETKKRRR